MCDKGETTLRLLLAGPFSATQRDTFCQGIVSVSRPEGLNLHFYFLETRQLWTRHLFLLVVRSDGKERQDTMCTFPSHGVSWRDNMSKGV